LHFIYESLHAALNLILSGDHELFSAILTSLSVSTWSIVCASVLGIPIGVAIGILRFPLKRVVITLLNTLMALPTVVVGLVVYRMISRQGPLGSWQLLFTPSAIVIGQTVLAIPIVAHYTLNAVLGGDSRILPTALTLGAGYLRSIVQLLHEVRFGIIASVIAGFGRVIAEVGVAMMLGGNIKGYTRTMTTAIALETSKGEFAFGLALGLILMVLALSVNLFLNFLQQR